MRTVVSVTLENKPGRLAALLAEIATLRINVNAVSVETGENTGKVHLLTTDPAKNAEALRGKGYEVAEHPAIELRLPNRVGALQRALTRLAESGVNVEGLFGSTPLDGQYARIVLLVDNAEAAEKVVQGL